MGRYTRDKHRACRRGLPSIAALVALIPLLSGCGFLHGLSGTQLSSPQVLTVTSPAFSSDVYMPGRYTCHGAGVSPPLLWLGALSRPAKSFAIVVDDSQAPITPYVYWIVFDISPNTTSIGENLLPTGARVALNSAGTARYNPPCPVGPPGSYHKYRFTVYALNVRMLRSGNQVLSAGAGLRETWSAIASHVIATGRLTARAKA